MRPFKQAFVVALFVALPVAFLFVRHMEATGQFDSIGLWYSLLVTVILSALAAGLLASAAFAIRQLRR
jgi:hypothetical protein